MIWYLGSDPVQKNQECAVPLGIQGENESLVYTADVSDWLALWPSGVVALVLQAPDRSEPYMANTAIDRETGIVTWTITNFDTSIVGYGLGELRIVSNDVVKKSYRFATYIRPSVLSTAAEPPAPTPEWISDLLEVASDVQGVVDAAEAARDAAQAAQAAAELAQDKAETAQGKAEDAQTAAETAQGKAETAQTNAETAASNAQTYSQQASSFRGQAIIAKSEAVTAQGKAETAQGKAEAAQTAAETAQGKAETAQTAAETAQGKAEDAQEAAESALASTLSAKDDAISAITQQQVTSVAAVQAKGTEVIASIPADYSELSADVSDLKSAIGDITGPNKNFLYYYPWRVNGAKITFDGDNIIVEATSASTYRSGWCDIDVTGIDYVTLSYNSKSSDSSTATAASIRYGFVINGSNTWNSSSYVTSSPAVIKTMGQDTLRVALYVDQASVSVGTKSTYNKLQVEVGTEATAFSKTNYSAIDYYNRKELQEFESGIAEVVEDAITTVGLNKYNPDTKTTGFINANTGTINTNADYFTSDFIDVSDFQYGYAFTPKARKILFYDVNKEAIAASYYTNETAAGVIALNSSYKYIRLSWYKTSTNVMVCDAATLPPYEPYEIIAKDGINYLNAETKTKVEQIASGGILNGKKWAVCGDSFTAGADSGTLDSGKYAGQKIVYPYIIGNRTGINIYNFFQNGRTLAFPETPGDFVNSLTCPTAVYYYQNIPDDSDYITIYLGINDEHHASGDSGSDGEDTTGVIPIGTITDNTVNTYYGAWNVVLTWLITNRPFAHIGIIVTNAVSSPYREAQIAIAKKYGIPYIDMNGDKQTPCMIRSCNTEVDESIRAAIQSKQAVNYPSNTHPNNATHYFESTFIQAFLESL